MAEPARQLATAPAPHRARGLMLAELPPPAAVNLRGDPADPAFLRATGVVLGAVLPLKANTVATADARTIVWLGPDEWLVLGLPGSETALAAALDAAVAGLHAAVTDVSGNRVLLRLTGPGAADVLAKGCSLDLDPRVFAPGQSAQTLVARAQVLLLARGDGFDILPRRSFGRYLRDWLEDAMQWA